MLDELKNYKKENSLINVKINGFVNNHEICHLLLNSNFIIVPSREDSIPVILSDATQFKLPLIAANVGDLGPLVTKYKIGEVFEYEDDPQLTKLIEKFTSLSKDHFSENFIDIDEIFNIEKVVKKFLKDIE